MTPLSGTGISPCRAEEHLLEIIEATFELEKDTKNTYRFQEVVEQGSPPKVKSIYIQKWAVGSDPPEKIRVTVEEA